MVETILAVLSLQFCHSDNPKFKYSIIKEKEYLDTESFKSPSSPSISDELQKLVWLEKFLLQQK